jgi:hypothetical protein
MALVSSLAVTLPLAAMATPIQESDDVAWVNVNDIQARGNLDARQGVTCALGGNGACILRVSCLLLSCRNISSTGILTLSTTVPSSTRSRRILQLHRVSFIMRLINS